jgi:hypothetical protein
VCIYYKPVLAWERAGGPSSKAARCLRGHAQEEDRWGEAMERDHGPALGPMVGGTQHPWSHTLALRPGNPGLVCVSIFLVQIQSLSKQPEATIYQHEIQVHQNTESKYDVVNGLRSPVTQNPLINPLTFDPYKLSEPFANAWNFTCTIGEQ